MLILRGRRWFVRFLSNRKASDAPGEPSKSVPKLGKPRPDLAGKPKSPETRAKLSAAQMGHVVTEATKDKLRGRVVSDEARQKIGNANRGKKHTPETRAQMSVSRRGRQHSEETKAKIAETNRITWATRRRTNASTDSEPPS